MRCFAPSPLASNQQRGQDLVAYLEELALEFPGKRFNLMGHSQGSPTARFAAHHRPDLVASVTAIGGANGPSHVADLLIDLLGASPEEVSPDNPGIWLAHHIAVLGATGLGGLIDIIDDPEDFAELIQNEASTLDAYGALHSLTRVGAMVYNSPCDDGLDDWNDHCGITDSVPAYLRDHDAAIECRTTGEVPDGWESEGPNQVMVTVTGGSPGVPADQIGETYPVRYWSYSGASPTNSDTGSVWVGWPFADPIIDAIESFPPAVQPLFPYSEGLAGDARFYFYKDPVDYFMGFTAATAVADPHDLYSAPVETDGLLSPCVTHLGDVIRDDYNMNHLDESDLLGDLDWLLDPDPIAGVAAGGQAQVRTDIVDDYVNCIYFFGWHCDPVYLSETEPTSLMRMQANRLREAGL